MKKALLHLIALFFTIQLVSAQDFEFGKITVDEMNMKSYPKDTSAHAVVLQEYGSARINVTADDNIKAIYEYHVKIKIFDSKAFDQGTINIPLYNGSNNDSYEDISDIKGVTYYKDDNGFTQQAELNEKKIYPIKENKHWANYKFALPGLRNGCIIEYKYRIESPYFEFNFHSWPFQAEIPKVYSEYQVHIPAFWNYNASIKGSLKLTKNTAELERPCFETHGAKCDCSFMTYGMADIPAFKEDEYMTSANNFKSMISFELTDVTSPYTGVKTRVTKEWKDIDYTLKTESYFGSQLKRKSLMKDKIAAVITGKSDDMAKARAIYNYCQKQFKWNKREGIYSENISKAIDAHEGSDADINLTLVTALNAAGLKAEAVLLSTRDNGAINMLYPVLSNFNYVVAKVNIGNQDFLLDATEPMLPFGMLPFRCLNDKGRVFSLDKPSYFIDLSLPQKEKSSYTLDVTLQDNGKLKGTLTNYSIGYEGYKRRLAIGKFNTLDEYVENLAGELPKWKIIKSDVKNVDSLDMPVVERYDVEIDVYKNMEDNNKLVFNPYFLNKTMTNPLKLSERLYPIDMGMPSEDRYVLTMHLPAQYTVEAPPQTIAIAVPNEGGRYISNYEPGDNTFNFTYFTQFNKSVYAAEEYPYLKEFFNKIIQSQKGEIVFKKK